MTHQEITQEADGHVRVVKLADVILEAHEGLHGAAEAGLQHLGEELQQVPEALGFDPQGMDGLDGCPRHHRVS